MKKWAISIIIEKNGKVTSYMGQGTHVLRVQRFL